MNNIIKLSSRLVGVANNSLHMLKHPFGKRDFARSIWHLSNKSGPSNDTVKILNVSNPSLGCSCGCGMKHIHTKGERELVEFLTEEIIAERKSPNEKPIPKSLAGFLVGYNGSEVELVQESEKEKIVISFNVNHTVDAEEPPPEINPTADKVDVGGMRSKPNFEIEITRGKTTLAFSCSFLDGTPEEGEYDDIFGIDELSIYEGSHNDTVYAVAGDVLDGYLYDLLMNLLEEKGISNEFAEKLSELSTIYEHSQYVKLLESLSNFTAGNK